MPAPWKKKCSCGRAYTLEEFQKLPYVGRMDKDEDGDKKLELRNCVCRSTIAATPVEEKG